MRVLGNRQYGLWHTCWFKLILNEAMLSRYLIWSFYEGNRKNAGNLNEVKKLRKLKNNSLTLNEKILYKHTDNYI